MNRSGKDLIWLEQLKGVPEEEHDYSNTSGELDGKYTFIKLHMYF